MLKQLIMTASQVLRDIIIVNFLIIVSFAILYGPSVSLEKIYIESFYFTFPAVIFIIIFSFTSGIYRMDEKYFSVCMFFVIVVKFCTFGSIAIVLISYYLMHSGVPRHMYLIFWFLAIITLAVIRIPWVTIDPNLFKVSPNSDIPRSDFVLKLRPALLWVKPERSELRSLIIQVASSVIAFLIIYHLLGYK